MLRLKPISLRDANEYVRQHHRHHKPVAGHKFSIGCEADGELVGVIIAGRPVSRYLDDGFTLEVRTEACPPVFTWYAVAVFSYSAHQRR